MKSDFTSSLYLGFRHPSTQLPNWHTLTEGVPTILRSSPHMDSLAQRIAALQGLQTGVLGPSTLHLFWDFIHWLKKRHVRFFSDVNAYPIGTWAVAGEDKKDSISHRVEHHNPEHLQQQLIKHLRPNEQPVLILDGYCPVSGELAPLADLLEVMADYNGMVLMDDTQSLGVFGCQSMNSSVYGHGGGGSVRYHNVNDHNIIVISSLAKAFGVPAAVLCGSQRLIEGYRQGSETAMHCSPVSNAHLAALDCALQMNQESGDCLRRSLLARVSLLRRLLGDSHLYLTPSYHPFQTFFSRNPTQIRGIYQLLQKKGVGVVLHLNGSASPALSALLRVGHQVEEIEELAYYLIRRY